MGPTARVYRNTGGSFSDIGAGLPGVWDSSAAWGDYDNDGDLDILLTGNMNYMGIDEDAPITRVYRNTGGGFTDSGIVFRRVYFGSTAWGDYDNDGDLDILLTGLNVLNDPTARIYRNTGGSFSGSGAGLPGVDGGNAAWGDYDNDGDLDILLTGDTGSGRIARIYRNEDCADLGLSKTVSPTTAAPGQMITFTLSFSNTGLGPARSVRLTDTIPVSLTNLSVLISGVALTDTGASPAYAWQVQDLAPGQGGIITLTGQISPNLVENTAFNNTAALTGTGDLTPANNLASAGVTVNAPTLAFSQAAYTVPENVGRAVITLTLSPAPFAPVTVDYASQDHTAIAGLDYTASSGHLTLLTGTTSATFTVPITDDLLAETDEALTLTLSSPTGAALTFPNPASLTLTDNDTPGLVITPSGGSPDLTLSEPASFATFTIRLTSQPTDTVTIGLTISDASECSLDTNPVTLDDVTWQSGLTVTVRAVDDLISDGPQPCTITTTASSSDPIYDGRIVADVTVTVNDDDTSGIRVSPTTGLTTTETGGTAAFALWLGSQPTAPVTVTLVSTASTEGQVGPAWLTFTPATWNISQTVTITGVNDNLDDGDQTYLILTHASSRDAAYQGFNPPDVTVTNLDDDTAGFSLNPTNLTVSEPDGPAVFTLSLRSQPVATVTLTLTSSDPGECRVTSPLLLTALNWQTGLSLTVTAVDDTLLDGDQPCLISGVFSSRDRAYDAQTITPLAVTVKDDETPFLYLPLIFKNFVPDPD